MLLSGNGWAETVSIDNKTWDCTNIEEVKEAFVFAYCKDERGNQLFNHTVSKNSVALL